MNRIKGLKATMVASVCAAATLALTASAAAQDALEPVFETNVTNDLNIASGEPEIGVNPTNPRRLAIIEFALGSAKTPAATLNPPLQADGDTVESAFEHDGRIMLSDDGGATWRPRPAPAVDPERAPGGGDPMLAYGPDGSLYAANLPFPKRRADRGVMDRYGFVMAYSPDGGRTFENAQHVPTPIDRPFLKVDQSTGYVYLASTGTLNPKTLARNVNGEGMVFDRWLTVWKPHLTGRSEPRRLGGPDFSAASGGTMTVANGVLATVFAIGGPAPGGGPPPKGPIPVPASLAPLVPASVTCSIDEPCAFLQTSSDQGRHWTRRYVPTPDAYGGIFLYLAGDPGRKGRYAIGYVTRDAAGLRVVVTDDYGKSWTKPVVVPVTLGGPAAAAPPSADVFARLIGGSIFKPWMDYGPTGVLGFMWRQRREDLMQNVQLRSTPGNSFGPAFDVYAALSCDGGLTWLAPVKVNAEPSPAGPNSYDDLSWITLDKRYAHVVWGDRRLISKVQNGPMGIGGVQVFYGRVPFATAAKGAACGRAG